VFSCGVSVLPLDLAEILITLSGESNEGPVLAGLLLGLSRNLVEEGTLVEHRGEMRDALTARLDAVSSSHHGPGRAG
jgi:hypothetical protein